MHKRLTTKDITITALCTALIVVGGFIKIPIGTVPITLQTLCVLLAGSLGGKKVGLLATSIYLIMGLTGIPVFTGGGGIFYLFKPTFGYILGFVAAGVIAGIAKNGFFKRAGFNLLGVLAIHLTGVIYFYCISNFYLNTPITLWKAFLTGSLIFIPLDAIKAVISALIAYKLAPVLKLS